MDLTQWGDLLDLAEKQVDVITQLGQTSTEERKNFSDCYYVNFKKEGISFCFKENKLDSIFLYNEGVSGYNQFKGKLPEELKWDMSNADVVGKLGEPEGKPNKGNVIPMFVDYTHLGIQIDFATKSFEDNTNPLTVICLYKPIE